MKRMKPAEIKSTAKRIADSWLACYSLVNAKKVALEVRKLLKAEEQRRKVG